jgi:hypothetical protein
MELIYEGLVGRARLEYFDSNAPRLERALVSAFQAFPSRVHLTQGAA